MQSNHGHGRGLSGQCGGEILLVGGSRLCPTPGRARGFSYHAAQDLNLSNRARAYVLVVVLVLVLDYDRYWLGERKAG
jgi:hypothetical protein